MDAIATFQRLVELSPNFHAAYRHLGFSKLVVGQADEAIPLLQRSIRFDPLNSYNRIAYGWIGNSLMLLGDNANSIQWQQRALAEGATAAPFWRAQRYLFMACAYASLGHLSSAQHSLGEANRIWPFATARNSLPAPTPRGLPDLTFAVQMSIVQESLRRVGLRDHSDEHADFGVTPVDALQRNLVGFTPTTVPCATTIRTEELVDLLERRSPVLIDVGLDSWGRSIPGAVGLQGSGHGATFSTERENRLRRKIQDLTDGDLSVPIVAFCVNSERFTSYNLALRLVLLGYPHVYWYRGGFEAWQVTGLPESDLELQDW
jgi:adenylate cyclase